MGDTKKNKVTFDNNPPSGDDSGKSGDDSGKIRKIHANWIIFLLVLIGCAVLPICIIAGIWIVQKIGGWVIGWECLGIDDSSNNIYFTDFLGGALGFMVGFILDKFVIERINNVLHYKALMRVLSYELSLDLNALCEQYTKDKPFYGLNEFIVDDVVMTAETISVIANIPFSKKRVQELIENIKLTHIDIEDLNNKCKEGYELFPKLQDKLSENDTLSENDKLALQLISRIITLLRMIKWKSALTKKQREFFLSISRIYLSRTYKNR